MIGTGTGVAPFRGLVQEIYREKGSWQGQVRLYYGARSGMDLLYENDEQGDLSNYYDETSFKAFRALIKRPMASDSDALQAAVQDHADDIWQQVQTPNTFVYLAGLDKIAATFGAVMVKAAGSETAWNRQLNRLRSEGRWSELIYS
jgi:ferredoxin--NADP+ reductase